MISAAIDYAHANAAPAIVQYQDQSGVAAAGFGPPPEAGEFSMLSFLAPVEGTAMSAPPSPAPFSTHLIRWTKHTENEFLRLAKAEALGRISDEDMVRLETYSAQRARLKSPRSAEEVLAEYRRARVVDQLTKALDAYAKEFGTPAG